ncbi:hypothetical protein [Lactiplantibacillus daowaiensis]|uniref:Phage protein n=1 Tax=Lactiplantibacillus daowaiensis TaxID=2559918 RepID=A0ABW1RXV2_9LACO|nr:hypothetical protein [Lactiplantibacillus daowaiensis]
MTEFVPYISAGINCHMMGRIISYSQSSHTCEVQPLPLQSDGDKRAPLTEVIVPASIYKIAGLKIKRNSVVWIGYCDRDMDNWTGANNYKIETKRMHSIQDAVVEAVIEE